MRSCLFPADGKPHQAGTFLDKPGRNIHPVKVREPGAMMALVPQMYFTESFVQSQSHLSPSKRSIRIAYRDEHLQQDIGAWGPCPHLITG